MASYSAPLKPTSKRRKQGEIPFLSGHDEVFGELLQGGVEVWTVEKSLCEDGFTFDFGVSLEEGNFGRKHEVICFTKRRVSKANNSPALNASNGYNRMVLIRAVASSTAQTREKFSNEMVQVSPAWGVKAQCSYLYKVSGMLTHHLLFTSRS